MGEAAYLSMKGICKHFGKFTANDHVNFEVQKGEVHALLGENGAGKSTLMNILSGLYQMDEGTITLNGSRVTIKSPKDAKNLGIGMVYQHFMLISAMTVVENIILSLNEGGITLGKKEICRRIEDLSQRYGLDIHPHRLVNDLSVGEQQRIEIMKVLCADAKLLILDEPTAVLTPKEAQGLFTILEKLKKEEHTIIFISHKLKEVMQLCDNITVLRKGKTVGNFAKPQTTLADLGDSMVGRKVSMERIAGKATLGDVVISMDSVQLQKHGRLLLDIQALQVQAGEILGIAGVDGNGQSELAAVLTGLLKPTAGEIKIAKDALQGQHPADYIKAGVTHIPEDRNRLGLVGTMNICENLVLKQIDEPRFTSAHGWRINYKALQTHALQMIDKYDIRTASEYLPVQSLSGGNAQKVILAREIEEESKALIAVHPTRGLDVGASDFVHQKLVQAKNNGCAVLLISADLDEILRVSDRVAVIYEGRIIGYDNPLNPNLNKLSLLMAGKECEESHEKVGAVLA